MMRAEDPFYLGGNPIADSERLGTAFHHLEEHDSLFARMRHELFLFPAAKKAYAESDLLHLYVPLFSKGDEEITVFYAAALLRLQRETKSQAAKAREHDKKKKQDEADISEEDKAAFDERWSNRTDWEKRRDGYFDQPVKGELQAAYHAAGIEIKKNEFKGRFIKDYSAFMQCITRGTRTMNAALMRIFIGHISRSKPDEPYAPLAVYREEHPEEAIQSILKKATNENEQTAKMLFYAGLLLQLQAHAEKTGEEKDRLAAKAEKFYQGAIQAGQEQDKEQDNKQWSAMASYNLGQLGQQEHFEAVMRMLPQTLLALFAQDRAAEIRAKEQYGGK